MSSLQDQIIEALAEEHGLEPEQFIIPIQFKTPTRQTARVRPSIQPRSPTMRIEIVQNHRVLRQHNHEGRSYIEAPPEGDYTIRLTNTRRRARSPDAPTERQLAVVSVDGLNIVTGEKAGFDGPGYVVLPGQSIEIPGWRRTNSEVAAFNFKPQEGSYTSQMGNGTSNTGVIGIAVFNEKHVPKTYVGLGAARVTRTTTTTTVETETVNERINRRARAKGLNPDGSAGVTTTLGARIDDGTLYSERNDSWGAGAAAAGAACAEEDDGVRMSLIGESGVDGIHATAGTTYGATMDSMEVSPLRSVKRRRRKSPELGTGYGARQTMYTEETVFTRASEVPFQVITLQYAVRAKLIEWGVPLPELPPTPSAFPASSASVQAPPGWRG